MNNRTDNGGVLMISTALTADQIISDGGITMTRLNAKRVATTCKYVLLCRTNAPPYTEWASDESVPAYAAFLIGTISDIKSSGDGYFIGIDSYASILKRNAWPVGNKIGVQYCENLQAASLRLGHYDFKNLNGDSLEEGYEVADAEIVVEAEPEIVTGGMSRIVTAKAPRRVTTSSNASVDTLSMPMLREIIAKALNVEPEQVSGTLRLTLNGANVTIEMT